MWRTDPFARTFTAAAAALFFLVTGFSGYRATARAAFFAGTRWTGHVIWWQVAVGLLFLVVAVYSFRQADKALSETTDRGWRHSSCLSVPRALQFHWRFGKSRSRRHSSRRRKSTQQMTT
jgi:hypothetical protein